MKVVCFLLAIFGLAMTSARGATSAEHWQTVWSDFRNNYPYTEHKGIDWNRVYETNAPKFAVSLSADEFAVRLNEALLILHDWHVAVQKPDGTWIGYQKPYARNFPAAPNPNYASVPYANYRNAGVLLHGTLTNNAAHVIIPTLSASAFDALSDGDLRSFFESYAGARGIILDLRYNSGGSEIHARRIAAFFHQTTTLYGYTRTRLDPDNLSPLNPKHVTPHPDLHLASPVVVLVGKVCLSSAEWLALMMREAPNAILMGDQTRGGSGNPVQRSIPELGVNYLISQWVAYDTEQTVFEDRGISPAIYMAPESSFDDAAQRDYLLEHAMEYINWRHSDGGAHQPVNWLTESDGDALLDVDEFVGGSNRTDPASFFRISVTREPPYKMSWSALARRSYAVETRPHFGEPWRALSHDPVPNTPGTAEQAIPDTSPAFYRLRADLAP